MQYVYLIPQQTQKNARRGLELRRAYGRGGTSVGLATARQLAKGGYVKMSFVRKVSQYFPRHAKDNLDQHLPPSNGWIAWLLWGGDAGWRWSRGIVERGKSL